MDTRLPLLVTIALTAVGWSVVHLVDRLLSAPIIEMYLSEPAASTMTLRLTNLTHDTVFRDLDLLLTAPEDGHIRHFAIVPVQPASEGQEPATTAGRSAEFKFPELQPGGTFYVEAIFDGAMKPSIRILLPSGPIRVVSPSLETFILKNETWILGGLIAGGSFLVLIYSVVCAPKKATPLIDNS